MYFIKQLFCCLLALWALTAPMQALAQTFEWSSVGTDGQSVDGLTVNATSGPVTMSVEVNSTIVGGGVNLDAYSAAGQGPASYEDDGTFGGLTNFVEFGFDNVSCDINDQFEVVLNFSVAVNNVQITIADVDQSSWDDIIEIELDIDGDGLAGPQNIKNSLTNPATGAPLLTLGADVEEDDETFADGYEGTTNVGNGSTSGNITLDTTGSGLAINAVVIRYYSGNDGNTCAGGGNPGSQRVGIGDVSFSGTTVPVTLSYFESNRAEGSLSLRWETLQEVGHAGFQVYARDAQGWRELSNGLIHENQSGSSLQRKTYATSFALADGFTPKWLALIDVSMNEGLVAHGPYRIGQAYGEKEINAPAFDWQSVSLPKGLSSAQKNTVAERIRRARAVDQTPTDGQGEH